MASRTSTPTRPDRPAELYGRRVLSGELVACKWVKLFAQRHFDDLETARARGLSFDVKAGERIIRYFRYLKHSKGEWAGQEFKLAGWQAFLLFVLFGWKRADGTRRFRTAYVEVARKNGKSSVAAGVGAYLFMADKERGAEVYSAATKRDQAKIIWGEAVRMIKASPAFKKYVTVYKTNLSVEATQSKFEPLSADDNTMDGLNVHGALIDELHAHKTRGTWDVLNTATGARRQPLIFAVTTAGSNRESICYEQHEYGEKVLEGVIEDDTFCPFMCTLDVGDDWTNPAVWVKSNPNLGISVKLASLVEQCAVARSQPAAQNTFMRLRLNCWTQNETKWIPMETWDKANLPVNEERLEGRTCYAGLDLASSIDIAAFVMMFPPDADGEPYTILPRFWIPRDNVRVRALRDRVPYEAWVRDGWIVATEGNVVDYKAIRLQIEQDYQRFAIRQLRFDRWGATQLTTELATEVGVECVAMGQGYASMSSPTKEFMKLLLEGKLAHGGHPVLRWMADNVMVTQDPAGNLKPSRDKSREKIDGIVASIMALDGIIRMPQSVYEEEGFKLL